MRTSQPMPRASGFPCPQVARTGTYYLRGRTRDVAGNWSAWTDLFTYRYDGTPPENPTGVSHALGIESTVWQRSSSAADFSWPVPHDEGSGIQGYQTYWGLDEQGTAADLLTQPGFQTTQGLCPASACTGYLRLRSVDNVGNQAGEWSTAFILRYDNAPPAADFTINGGEGQTGQTQINLNITASDLGSGVKAMRFSTDGVTWTPWEVFAPVRAWQLPPVSRQTWPIYLQVQDGVGLVSVPAYHTVTLDVNPQQARSANFRLFDQSQVAGSGQLDSASYRGHGTLGQVNEAPQSSSASYQTWSGYEAGSLAIPVIAPGHDEFITINGAVVSGNGVTVMASAGYHMAGAMGEAALPNNQPDLTSASFRHQPGFLAASPSRHVVNQTYPGEKPQPDLAPDCTVPSIQIERGDPFVNHPDVTLSLCAPHAVEMMVSNQKDLAGAAWEPYAIQKAWILASDGQEVKARFVYAAFRDVKGAVYGTYGDDIILDLTRPEGSLMLHEDVLPLPDAAAGLSVDIFAYIQADRSAGLSSPVQANEDGTVNLLVDAQDNNSGLVDMQLSQSAIFSDTTWEPFVPVKAWTPADDTDGWKTVYARFKDSAGNISEPSQITFLVDRQSPNGAVWIERHTLRPEERQITLDLYAQDDLVDEGTGTVLIPGSGLEGMRLSDQPDLANAAWQPYQESLAWPVELDDKLEGTVYAQFRDQAGNVSPVYSDRYQVDLAAPEVTASVEQGSGLVRTIHISAHDDLSRPVKLYLGSDPAMLESVTGLDYQDGVYPWTFDDRRVVWLQVEDEAGNRSQPYPLYASDITYEIFMPVVGRP